MLTQKILSRSILQVFSYKQITIRNASKFAYLYKTVFSEKIQKFDTQTDKLFANKPFGRTTRISTQKPRSKLIFDLLCPSRKSGVKASSIFDTEEMISFRNFSNFN